MSSKIYWPFEVLAPERQTEQHKSEICFLETAFREGYKPYTFGAGNYGASAASGRVGEIVVRGRRRWKVFLFGKDQQSAASFCNDFESAGEAVLRWL